VLPLVAVAAARGLTSIGAAITRPLPAGRWRVVAAGLAAAALAAPIASPTIEAARFASSALVRLPEAVHERQVGALIAGGFPDATRVVTTSWSIPFYAECTPCHPMACQKGYEVAACVESMRRECASGGELPFIVDIRDDPGPADRQNVGVVAWVRANGRLIGAVGSLERLTEVYALSEALLAEPAPLPSEEAPPG